MAQIVINEISQNYSYNIGTNSYATVALPISASWGPGYFNPTDEYAPVVTGSNGSDVAGSNGATVVGADAEGTESLAIQQMLEHTVWQRFPATQAGLESFVATYRGPASDYRLAKDFSYQMAMTLITAGYDILVCRLSPGAKAECHFVQKQSGNTTGTISFKAKYPGTFGNNLQIAFKKVSYLDPTGTTPEERKKYCWNIITYVVDASGVKTSVESKSLVFKLEDSTDSILYYKEVESNFWEISSTSGMTESAASEIPVGAVNEGGTLVPISPERTWAKMSGGTDYDTQIDAATVKANIAGLAQRRYDWAKYYSQTTDNSYNKYAGAVRDLVNVADAFTQTELQVLYWREWLYSSLIGDDSVTDAYGQKVGGVFDLLKDKLAYNPQRIISPGWDDQDLYMYTDDPAVIDTTYEQSVGDNTKTCMVPISPMHLKIMDIAYYGRCATGFIDVPKIVDRRYVHIEDDENLDNEGYVQKLARVVSVNAELDANGTLFHTHSAFFAPWGQYTYVGTGKQNEASPSFLALMIQRAQILNQPIQYEWALPTDRKHNLRIGKMEYTVPKKVLDKWQKLEGASVNVITTIPDLGTNLWGNSTLFEVPPATYQALANLSTRYLVNAVEDVAYKCGISITFQYNNNQAYNKFYAGVTPLLDTMKNVGAIEDYRVTMSADINGEDHVNANTVIGKIWLIVNGVINDIYVDLIALPAGLGIDLNSLS